jgi:hypothetical protein
MCEVISHKNGKVPGYRPQVVIFKLVDCVSHNPFKTKGRADAVRAVPLAKAG